MRRLDEEKKILLQSDECYTHKRIHFEQLEGFASDTYSIQYFLTSKFKSQKKRMSTGMDEKDEAIMYTSFLDRIYKLADEVRERLKRSKTHTMENEDLNRLDPMLCRMVINMKRMNRKDDDHTLTNRIHFRIQNEA
eukprot:907224_1